MSESKQQVIINNSSSTNNGSSSTSTNNGRSSTNNGSSNSSTTVNIIDERGMDFATLKRETQERVRRNSLQQPQPSSSPSSQPSPSPTVVQNAVIQSPTIQDFTENTITMENVSLGEMLTDTVAASIQEIVKDLDLVYQSIESIDSINR